MTFRRLGVGHSVNFVFSFGGWALLLMLLMVIHPVIKRVLLFAAGVLIGIIATNLLIVRIAIRQWPILYRIVAWEKVEYLLKEDQPSPPESA